MELTKQLVDNIIRTDYTSLPQETRKTAINSILDTIGVMHPPSGLDQTCQKLSEMVLEDEGGNGISTLIGLGTSSSAVMAAYLNGCFVHVLDYDDTIDKLGHHPAAQTVPAALAVAQKVGNISGQQLITAVVLGGDLGARLSSAPNGELGKDHHWFPISNFGVFSATAAAGKILALDEEQMINALGLALHRCHGQLGAVTAPESELRAIRDGFINKEGVICALMAGKGVKACNDAIERFFESYYSNDFNHEQLTSELGQHFLSSEVSLKPWPCCRLTHGYIQATNEIINKHTIACEDISEIVVEVSPGTRDSFCEPEEIKKAPVQSIQAKFSLFFPVALSLLKRPEISDFLPENLSRPEVLNLTKIMRYRINEKDFGYEASISPAIVELQTRDGQIYKNRVDTVYGHPENPLSHEDIFSKFKDCLQYSKRTLAATQIDELAHRLSHLDEEDNLDNITALLT